LVEVQIFTGRMHQIRLQAETLGMPLVGDELYNKVKPDNRRLISNYWQLGPELSLPDFAVTDFQNWKLKLFGQVSFCLLANELIFQLPSRQIKQVRLFSVEEL